MNCVVRENTISSVFSRFVTSVCFRIISWIASIVYVICKTWWHVCLWPWITRKHLPWRWSVQWEASVFIFLPTLHNWSEVLFLVFGETLFWISRVGHQGVLIFEYLPFWCLENFYWLVTISLRKRKMPSLDDRNLANRYQSCGKISAEITMENVNISERRQMNVSLKSTHLCPTPFPW